MSDDGDWFVRFMTVGICTVIGYAVGKGHARKEYEELSRDEEMQKLRNELAYLKSITLVQKK